MKQSLQNLLQLKKFSTRTKGIPVLTSKHNVLSIFLAHRLNNLETKSPTASVLGF